MATTGQVDNYPGFDEGIDGFELAEKMQRGAERFGVETEYAEVNSVDLSPAIKKNHYLLRNRLRKKRDCGYRRFPRENWASRKNHPYAEEAWHTAPHVTAKCTAVKQLP